MRALTSCNSWSVSAAGIWSCGGAAAAALGNYKVVGSHQPCMPDCKHIESWCRCCGAVRWSESADSGGPVEVFIQEQRTCRARFQAATAGRKSPHARAVRLRAPSLCRQVIRLCGIFQLELSSAMNPRALLRICRRLSCLSVRTLCP